MADDRSGVSLATGFVDFSTGRNSIVTAPGPGSAAEVKVFAFPLLTPIGRRRPDQSGGTPAARIAQPANTASFVPFGDDYRGGVSLATGWLAGSLGGAKRIVVGQLADAGTVKVFSSGSALDGGPALYLHSPSHHGHGADLPRDRELQRRSTDPGGVRVATTSTTSGAHLLVSGVAQGAGGSVLKYDLVRPNAVATTLAAVRLGQVHVGTGPQPAVIAGD